MAQKTNAQQKVEEKVEELKVAVAVANEEAKPVTPRLVQLNHPDPNAVIFYTTDGTYPIPNKCKQYVSPFYVSEDTLIKCVALVGDDVSPVTERFYNVR